MRTPEWIKTVAVMSVCTLLPAFAAPEVGPETGERDFEKTAVFDAEQEDAAITAFRLFAEPLLPLGEVTTAEENAALRSALQQFSARTKPDDAGALQAFVDSHPQSAWRPTLTVALAQFYFDQGYFTRATALWEEAWALTKAFTEGRGKAVGDLVVGELAMMQARVGNYERVEAVLREIHARPVVGSATERIASARDGLALMKLRPESSFKCGPYAVGSIFVAQQGEHAFPPAVLAAESTVDGTSLVQVAELAKQVGLDYQMAFREPGAPLLVPSVVNWKATHFAAIVREEAGRYLVKDPTFLQDFWVTADAVDDESSGYFLVPRGELPEGWRIASVEEARNVWGRGAASNHNPRNTRQRDPKDGGDNCGPGMPGYQFTLQVVSLNIQDTPIGYAPPYGPDLRFTLVYNQREAEQPATFPFANLGVKWTHNWQAYVEDNPSNLNAEVFVFPRGGGSESYGSLSGTTPTSAPQRDARAVLVRTNDTTGGITYERRFPDGSKEVYAVPDTTNSGAIKRRVLLKEVHDPIGNHVTLTYTTLGTGEKRLSTISDPRGGAVGLTFIYQHGDPLKITKVTDRYGRSVTITYTAGLLGGVDYAVKTLTDPVGILSTFNYVGGTGNGADFINWMSTPYGTTNFAYGDAPAEGNAALDRWLSATDPEGKTEKIRYVARASDYPGASTYLPSEVSRSPVDWLPQVPDFSFTNGYLDRDNVVYWDRKAYAAGGNQEDYSKAKVYYFLHTTDRQAQGVIGGTREAMDLVDQGGRVWYHYGDHAVGETYYVNPASSLPKMVVRMLANGTGTPDAQYTLFDYNAQSRVTMRRDPAGRVTLYTYDENGIDLTEVRQRQEGATGAGQLLTKISYFPSGHALHGKHLPQSVTDASGQVTTFAYNAQGQLTSTTNPLGEVTSYEYLLTGNGTGNVHSIKRAAPGQSPVLVAYFTYDSKDRVYQATEIDGQATADHYVRFEYDDLDRVTKVTYPDGTFKSVSFVRASDQKMTLDPTVVTQRDGRATQLFYNGRRELVRALDPSARQTLLEWCLCGSLQKLTDPAGNVTDWSYDASGRLTQKKIGSQIWSYEYQAGSSRLQRITDPKGQKTEFTYTLDGKVASRSHVVAPGQPTAGNLTVSFAYDPVYGRLTTMTDVTGTTTYNYKSIPSATPVPATTGNGRLSGIDGPLANDTIQFAYDALGRIVGETINGIGETKAFDYLGRPSSVSNPLGTFAVGYADLTPRVASLTYPNSQSTLYSYLTATDDKRLATIEHRRPDQTNLSTHDYILYDVNNSNVMAMMIQNDASVQEVHHSLRFFSDDNVDQLTRANATEDVQWTTLEKTTASDPSPGLGSRLDTSSAKTTLGWGDCDAVSRQWMTGDGFMEFRFGQSNKAVMVGLSDVNSGSNYTTMDYAIYGQHESKFRIYEFGVPVAAIDWAPFTATDRFRIERIGTSVKYFKNSVLIYTSTVPSKGSLLVDTAFYHPSAFIQEVRLAGGRALRPVDWTAHVFTEESNPNPGEGTTLSVAATKTTSAWNADAVGTEMLGGDCLFTFRFGQANRLVMAGLSDVNENSAYTTLDYAIYGMGAGTLQIRENGTPRINPATGTADFGPYSPTDVFRIERRGGVVRYFKNHAPLYVSAVASTAPLAADVSFYQPASSLTHCQTASDSRAVIWKNHNLTGATYGTDDSSALAVTSGKTTSAWNADAVSTWLVGGDGGGFSFRFGQTNALLMIGLSANNSNAAHTTLDYAIYGMGTGNLQIRELGTARLNPATGSTDFGPYTTSDAFSIRRDGTTVSYYKNHTLLYTSTVSSEVPLRVDTSFYSPYPGGALLDCRYFPGASAR